VRRRRVSQGHEGVAVGGAPVLEGRRGVTRVVPRGLPRVRPQLPPDSRASISSKGMSGRSRHAVQGVLPEGAP